jgi:hypothetical protein
MAQTHDECGIQWRDQMTQLEAHTLGLQNQLDQANKECKRIEKSWDHRLSIVEYDLMRKSNELDK